MDEMRVLCVKPETKLQSEQKNNPLSGSFSPKK